MDDVYYHTCGYPVVFETRTENGSTTAEFHDGGRQDSQDPEAIEACPNCGEVLLLGDLTPEPIDEWW